MKRDPRALEIALADLERQNLRRVRATVEAFAEPGNRVIVAVDDSGAGGAHQARTTARGAGRSSGRPSRSWVDFSSNDYLALGRHPAAAAAMAASAEHWGTGSGASHLVTGHGREHAQLEEELAEFTGRERALLFSTGYMANLAVVTSLAGRGEAVLLDRLSHASLIDAALLSGARFARYAHADAAAAGRALDAATAKVAVVATDGIFSMDGDIAPLPPLAHASRAHGAWLVVDDAHGLGVVGNHGRGSLEQLGMSHDDVPVLVGTLGKAFGSFGAFVAGSADLIEFLIQKARPYIYTTALPQPVAAAARASLRIAQRETWRRERVTALTERFHNAAGEMGIPVGVSATPIQPILLGSSSAALQAQQELLDAGFWVVAIRPPTVPRGSARLRVTLSAAHTETQVDALIEALARVCRSERMASAETASTETASAETEA